MANQFEQYMTPPPLCREPGFIGDTRALVDKTGGIAHAVAETFDRSNITVRVQGDTSLWTDEGQGAILVGDHRNGVEYAPLLAMFGSMGREDIRFVAKPFSMQARIMGSLSMGGIGLTLPVIPSTLARDRDNKLNRDLYWRITNKGDLPTKKELKQLNSDTLQDCADLAVNGHAVTLYPAGGVMDATARPWQRGLGRIVQRLPDEARDSVQIIPFRFDDFSKLRLIRSLTMAHSGLAPRPYTIILKLGQQGTVNELLGDLPSQDADSITEALRQQFVQEFNSPEQQ